MNLPGRDTIISRGLPIRRDRMKHAINIGKVPRNIWKPRKPGEPPQIATLLDGQDLVTPGAGGAIEGSSRITVLVQNYRPGGTHVAHSHDDVEQVFFAYRGRGRFMLDDEWFDISEGDLVFAPRGVSHAAENDSDGEMTLIFISVPVPKMPG